MNSSGLRGVVENRRLNAVVGWVLIVLLLISAGGAVPRGDLLWAGFIASVVILLVLPAARYGNVYAMLPWEVVALAALPVITRLLVAGVNVFGITLTGRVSTYFAVAAVALIIAVELDVFTPVRMTYSFAVFFVVIATMAAAGVWAVVKWFSDLLLGTAFYPPASAPAAATAAAHEALMWDFVAATAVGLLAGLLFEWYFRRHADTTLRLPDEIEREIADELEDLPEKLEGST